MGNFDIGSILGGVFGGGGVWAGTGSGKYAGLAKALAIGGGVAKAMDADNKGLDDAFGNFAIAGSKICQAVDSGDQNKILKAIDAAQIALDAVRQVASDNLPVVNN